VQKTENHRFGFSLKNQTVQNLTSVQLVFWQKLHAILSSD